MKLRYDKRNKKLVNKSHKNLTALNENNFFCIYDDCHFGVVDGIARCSTVFRNKEQAEAHFRLLQLSVAALKERIDMFVDNIRMSNMVSLLIEERDR